MPDVFVSHSHKDEARARALVQQLKSWGIDVYVDFHDDSLSSLPSAAIADTLLSRLRICRLLVFAFSEVAVTSKWMPWELGLAHGVIGRVVLWPFTKRALRAKETQEYLHLYEALEPATAEHRLKEIISEAKMSPTRPADLRAMEDLAAISMAKAPESANPTVASDFLVGGPLQLYSAWIQGLLKAARK